MRKKPTNRGKSSANAPGVIRIIAGLWRGRKLPVHDIQGLRPTTDRVKETVFNWLMADVRGSICLDCFAGSGALGFEALSRGAQKVLMVEQDKLAANQLKHNLALLDTTNGQVHQGDCLAYLAQKSPDSHYDLVFIDPPFRQGLAAKTITLLTEQQWLTQGALIYVEVESELTGLDIPPNWTLLKEKSAGQVRFSLYRHD